MRCADDASDPSDGVVGSSRRLLNTRAWRRCVPLLAFAAQCARRRLLHAFVLTTRLCSVTEISPYGAQSERGWRAITMAPSESYQHVVKGGLKFKGGGGLPTAGGVKKKKKKDKKVRSTPAPLGGCPRQSLRKSHPPSPPRPARAERRGEAPRARRGRLRRREETLRAQG